MLLFVLLSLFLANDVLVLKNGKMIRCETYQRKGQQVSITTDGKSFSLPEQAIDWPRTEDAQKALDQHLLEKQKQAEAAEEAALQAQEQEERERQERINKLMERGIESEKAEIVDETIQLSRKGNSLIVDVRINNRGPYQFILDTGASKTVMAPALMNELGIAYSQDEVKMVGVAGRVVSGGLARLDRINVGRAVVSNFQVSVFAIKQLNAEQIQGLLGQDFLNHFKMELDGANNTLRLRAHQRGNAVGSIHDQPRNVTREEVRSFFNDYNQAMKTLRSAHNTLKRQRSMTAAGWNNLDHTNQTISGLEARLSRILIAMKNPQNSNSFSTKQLQRVHCLQFLLPVIRGMNSVSSQMLVMRNQQSEEAVNQLNQRYQGLSDSYRTFDDCNQ